MIELLENETWIDYMRRLKPDITDEEAEYILWNETCYPFDNETTLKQIYTILKQPNQ